MKRRTYKRLMSLVITGMTVFSLLLPSGTTFAFSGGVDAESVFSEQMSSSDAEEADSDSDEEVQGVESLGGETPEVTGSDEETSEGIGSDSETPEEPGSEEETSEESGSEGGASEGTDSDGETLEVPDSNEEILEEKDSEGEEQEEAALDEDASEGIGTAGETPEEPGSEEGASEEPCSEGGASEGTDSDGETLEEPDSNEETLEEKGLEDDEQEEATLDEEVLLESATKGRASGGVTYETTKNYTHNIYANGQPLLIVSSGQGYSELYIDTNRNGIVDDGEQITEFWGDGTTDGILHYNGYGYFLANTTIYGGGKDGECQYDTSVTLIGKSDPNTPSVWNIVGGNASGTLTGNTCVNILGGTVANVYGGNGISGRVTGDTKLVFGENALVIDGIYGGGAGNDDFDITEVAGSTNITINGGEFYNIYGGGARNGATVGNSYITINGGHISGSVFGGGEEDSYVTGKASITMNGGSVGNMYASGACFNNSVAEVGEAEIHLNGGTVQWFSALTNQGNENGAIKRALSLEIAGGTFSESYFYIGLEGQTASLEDVKVIFKDVKVNTCNFYVPLTGNVSITFDNAFVSNMYLANNILENVSEATISYVNCGSAENGWVSQPSIKGSYLNGNKFSTILLKDSYIKFNDESKEGADNSLRACAEKLIVDGGALWVSGFMTSYMPQTEFLNTPLLLRTNNQDLISFDSIPSGTARIQWINEDGTDPDNLCTRALVEAPTDTPNRKFTSGETNYGLQARPLAHGNGIWWTKAWYVINPTQICTCQLLTPLLQEAVFPLSGESAQTVVTLKDIYEGSTAYSRDCPVIEHEGTVVTAEYSLISEGTTAPGASISDDQLTVEGAGSVHVGIRQQLNGKILDGDCYVQFMEMPDSDSFTFTVGMIEELTISFGEIDAGSILNNAILWSDTDKKYVDKANYSVTADENKVRFIINKEYLESLGLGEYGFRASVPYFDGGNAQRGYVYCFTVNIVPVIEVDDPIIEISKEGLDYDGKPKEPSVVVKYKDTDISEEEYSVIHSEEYEVRYENNVNVGTATVTITDKEGGRYAIKGKSGTFEIVNNYEAKNGTDYQAELNENGWTNKDFVISATEGHLLSTGNTLKDKWVETLPPQTEETSDGSVTFYVQDTKTGLISLVVTQSYKLDQTAPKEADILFDEKSVKTELQNITFSDLFGENIKVEITAEDALSGISDISYLRSGKKLTQEELENTDGWICEREFEIPAEDGEKFVIYGKVSDLAGNTIYIASQGGEFDLKAPEISGIEHGSTYYVTQIANVTDAYLETITINGEAVSENEKVALSGNREATYVIKAVDQLGHETVVTVTMKPISSLAEPIKGLTEENVTFDDAEIILQVLKKAEGIIVANASQEEKEELQTLIDTCELLYQKALMDYRILEGDGSKWTQGTNREITFKANGAFSKFAGILVDGQSVAPEDYTATEGNTVITLKRSLLETLPVGTHSLTVLYSDGGQASAEFEILEDSVPGTVEENPGSGEEDPGTVEENPGTVGEDPGTVEENPGSGEEDPGTVEENPGTGGEDPGTDIQSVISPQTGDNSSFMLPLIFWMLSVIGIVGVSYDIVRRRRRK